MYIKCKIQKVDGSPVFVDYEGVRYVFTKNEFGDAVCFVGNQAHQRRLLKMGPGSYQEYRPPEEATTNSVLGAAPVPLGGRQKPTPPPPMPPTPLPDEPLPDALTVDEALAAPDGDAYNMDPIPEAPAAPPKKAVVVEEGSPVDWADHAKEAKVSEFKFLQRDKFKAYIDDNRDAVPGWPKDVQAELAKKINNLFPDQDPDIKGFDLNDFDG